MAWTEQLHTVVDSTHAKMHPAACAPLHPHKAACSSEAHSDHEEGTMTPPSRESPARSPESHVTTCAIGLLNHASELPVERGSSPTTSATTGLQAVQASLVSENTAAQLGQSTLAVSTPLLCNRSTAASPVAASVKQEEEQPTTKAARRQRTRRTVMAPLMEILLELNPPPCAAPPPVVVRGVRLAPHVASKTRMVATGLHNGCASLLRADGDSAITSHKRQRTALPATPACERVRDFEPGEHSPQTLGRACRFLLQQDDYCNAAGVQRRMEKKDTVLSAVVISNMRNQHRHISAAHDNVAPVPMQFVEAVLQECTTWMAS